jgi:signal transduction histidine kinase
MHAKQMRKRNVLRFPMQPNLAQVLNTLAHEIRTPLAVSQGYLKLYLDGRLTNVDDTRRRLSKRVKHSARWPRSAWTWVR